MARGAVAKEQIVAQILKTFPNSFKYDKEIRIPVEENGEIIQIKVALTAAKTNVEAGGESVLPGETKVIAKDDGFPTVINKTTKIPLEPTEEEKKNVSNLLQMLGF